jgi:hypothetical protein
MFRLDRAQLLSFVVAKIREPEQNYGCASFPNFDQSKIVCVEFVVFELSMN